MHHSATQFLTPNQNASRNPPSPQPPATSHRNCDATADDPTPSLGIKKSRESGHRNQAGWKLSVQYR
ncbi:uncharacterized protein L3040_009139 [Drepanopeziza brunnea f. sp. 'multigermtubi']|uniref:uncharacterized protein n=1 Tax=Drepanopeziza brunnea f. sp. 'multigermtubi' TaxID=698441 RepID=UPI0023984683|nr:hypothetical protein L3040_009139 [Drepanopeziza brunnea f. sp. 'multigermtubi']